MLIILACLSLWCRVSLGVGDHCGLVHSLQLGFHCRCFMRNQSLLAVTRGLIEPLAAVWGRVRTLSLKPE